jgi:hypothetical protein
VTHTPLPETLAGLLTLAPARLVGQICTSALPSRLPAYGQQLLIRQRAFKVMALVDASISKQWWTMLMYARPACGLAKLHHTVYKLYQHGIDNRRSDNIVHIASAFMFHQGSIVCA